VAVPRTGRVRQIAQAEFEGPEEIRQKDNCEPSRRVQTNAQKFSYQGFAEKGFERAFHEING